MRAYLIDPAKKTVTEVEVDGDYRSIYKLINADMFDAVRINRDGDVIYVDDEGLLKPQSHFYHYGDLGHDLTGKGLVLGTDDEGNSVEPEIDLEKVRSKITWLSAEDIGLKPDAAAMDQTSRYDPVFTPMTNEQIDDYLRNPPTPQWEKED